MDTQVFLIMAFGRDGQVGLNNDLPWDLPAELKHFRKTTVGRPVIMGRKTADAIGGPLKYRRNIVISESGNVITGFETAPSIETALRRLHRELRVFIIGGPSIWMQSLKYATHLVLSEIDYRGPADASLPEEFFATIRKEFVLKALRPQEGFTVTYWARPNAN
ncbi:dihydrofolate reductase [Pseudomonas nitritireducens]|uniref:dihydrofolate reductase n=1 Tax=Pseudomonas nitroreducens TaxID=46680 RepID=A0A7W7KPW8_PSENT|nr:dihydrofolate reductase [Pseudomonas nitritireducens]MBB4866789.1 dihydrofolate reductase [Pseudomonas nitritireducens]